LSDRGQQFDPKKFLAKIGGGRTIARYRKNQRVFSQGEDADSIFYIQKGRVKVTVVSKHGKEAVVAMQGADEFCGEGCLTGQTHRMATATALVDSDIMRLDKANFVRSLRLEPNLSEMFISHLLTRTVRVEEDLIDQLFNSSEKRLARVLLLLARYGTDAKTVPLPKISQEILAEMVGTTRPRVNYFMNKFRDLGFIEYNGDLKVNRSLLTVVLHD
jgi:CRP-like cAMP-binding protein